MEGGLQGFKKKKFGRREKLKRLVCGHISQKGKKTLAFAGSGKGKEGKPCERRVAELIHCPRGVVEGRRTSWQS